MRWSQSCHNNREQRALSGQLRGRWYGTSGYRQSEWNVTYAPPELSEPAMTRTLGVLILAEHEASLAKDCRQNEVLLGKKVRKHEFSRFCKWLKLR